MSEPFLGEIRMFCGNFAPRGWATCDGQLLPIAQNTALFSILGTTFGGNGQTMFGLPDLRGRVPVHPGTGPGLSSYNLGQAGGSEQVALLSTQMPPHAHTVQMGCNSSAQNTTANDPTNHFPSASDASNIYATAANAAMGAVQSAVAGGGQPHENIQPFTCVNFIIALEGIFPSRS